MSNNVTLIPGMFSPLINTFLGTYFIDQMEYLGMKGIDYSIQPIHTEETIEKNATIIYKNVHKQKDLTAFCHSKGGIDLLHALITYPDIRRSFKKIIFMQCPFYGTPLADTALAGPASIFLTKILIKSLFNGNLKSVIELSEAYRKEYMAKNKIIINEALDGIDVICIGSNKMAEPGRFDSILKIPRDFMKLKYNVPNDGMIPTNSAFIPGIKSFKYNNLDHASAVIRLTPQHFDRKNFSKNVFEGKLQ